MSGKGPMEMLEEVKADVEAPGVVFERLCEGESLREIARSWGCAVGRFVQWYMEEHGERYDAALRVRADELAHGALADAKGAKGETVVADRLRVETKLKVAGKWDRARYGEQVKLERVERFEVSEQLVGLASAMLLGRSVERVVVGSILPGQATGEDCLPALVDSPPLSGPAPALVAQRKDEDGLI